MEIYLDNAATMRMSDTTVKAILPFLTEKYGNPSSLHAMGRIAYEYLFNFRRQLAECLGAYDDEIYFTSGGTESNNQALLTAASFGTSSGKTHIISQKTEHHAILNVLKRLEKQGFEIELLDTDSEGNITAEQVNNAIRKDTALVTIMTANNEIGTIMPIEEIGKVCREKGVLFHTDAVQAVGHIPINVKKMGCDMLSLSAHKFGGMKSVGALYVRRGILPSVLIEGGGQERGRRSGTENLVGIASMVYALAESTAKMDKYTPKLISMRDRFIKGLLKIPDTKINGSLNKRLPGNVSVCFGGIMGESLSIMLSGMGIYVSAGSACASGSLSPSHVLTAIGVPEELAYGALRISLSEDNILNDKEIEYLIFTIRNCVEKLRKLQG